MHAPRSNDLQDALIVLIWVLEGAVVRVFDAILDGVAEFLTTHALQVF
jgi:hypothetical protein